MSWRDFIVTSQPGQTTLSPSREGDCVDIVDSVLSKEKKNSSSYKDSSPQILTPRNEATKTTKPPESIPLPPLCPGWLVAYRDRTGCLRGGCEERDAGTVETCRWDGSAWTVCLANGETVPLRRVVSVGKIDADGRLVAAWQVRAHGIDGN
jgi:hypothetical protein